MENKVPRYLNQYVTAENISRNMEDICGIRARLFGHISVGDAIRSLYQDIGFHICTLTNKDGRSANFINKIFLEPRYDNPSIPNIEITIDRHITLIDIVEYLASKFILTMSYRLNKRDVVEYPPLSADDPDVIIQAATKYSVYTVSPEFMKHIKGE